MYITFAHNADFLLGFYLFSHCNKSMMNFNRKMLDRSRRCWPRFTSELYLETIVIFVDLKKNLDCENKYIDFILLNIWLENISFLWKTSPIPWRFAKMMTDVSIWVKSSRVGLKTANNQTNKTKNLHPF